MCKVMFQVTVYDEKDASILYWKRDTKTGELNIITRRKVSGDYALQYVKKHKLYLSKCENDIFETYFKFDT